MLVKNTMTGEKIEKSTAFIVKGTRNMFFDSEEQYNEYTREKEAKKTLWTSYMMVLGDKIIFVGDMFQIAKRHFNSLTKTYDTMYLDYMFKHITLDNIGDNIKFVTPKAQYSYYYKVISNKLAMNYKKYLEVKANVKNKEKVNLKSDKEFEISKTIKHKKREDILNFIGG